MIDQMNVCLFVGLHIPKAQTRIDEYYEAMVSISKEHQGRWDDIPKKIDNELSEKNKRIVSRSEVFETMFDCMNNDVVSIVCEALG